MGAIDLTYKGSREDFQLLFHGTPVADRTEELLLRLDALDKGQENILSKVTLAKEALEKINTVTNEIADAIDTVVVHDQEEDDAFRTEIADLKQKLADGQLEAADLDALTEGLGTTKGTLEGVRDALKAMGTDPTDPIPPVDIPPVVVDPPTDENPPVENPGPTTGRQRGQSR